jgi:poly-gamma-glutamate synthesis protein (capsule biosynthesis protein)
MKRRKFLNHAASSLAVLLMPATLPAKPDSASRPGQLQKDPMPMNKHTPAQQSSDPVITVFLCGDVMTGRAIDQILPHPGKPDIYERSIQDARMYVDLAEKTTGPIPKPVPYSYIWGDALGEFERVSPDLRIINLETSITRSDDVWHGKGINYRMHPNNIPGLTAAGIDGCVLANNHVLDWGYDGLKETLSTLHRANIKTAGAGDNIDESLAPAVFELPGKGRVLLFSFGHISSGIPYNWQASENQAGINVLYDLSTRTVHQIRQQIAAVKRNHDIVIASIHWGGNWGYQIPVEQTRFARDLIDQADVDIIHGHSSHHPKGIEIYRNRPIIYGCGDFINDYEGISGHEEFRSDLSLMYFVTLDAASGDLVHFELVPTQIKNLRVNHTSYADAQWLADMLNWQGRKRHTRVQLNANGTMRLLQA